MFFVSIFGALAVSFLWLRDARIFFRTGYDTYRKRAYWGVLLTALAWVGCALCKIPEQALYFLGIGLVLLALYLQSRMKKDNVWNGDESAWKRFTGCAPRRIGPGMRPVNNEEMRK